MQNGGFNALNGLLSFLLESLEFSAINSFSFNALNGLLSFLRYDWASDIFLAIIGFNALNGLLSFLQDHEYWQSSVDKLFQRPERASFISTNTNQERGV